VVQIDARFRLNARYAQSRMQAGTRSAVHPQTVHGKPIDGKRRRIAEDSTWTPSSSIKTAVETSVGAP